MNESRQRWYVLSLLVLGAIAYAALFVLILWGLEAQGASAIDRAALLEAICQHETRGEAEPHKAEGDSGESIGRCQVKIETAALVAFGLHLARMTDSDRAEARANVKYWLQDRIVGPRIAARVLERCIALTSTIERATYCYNAGPNAKFEGPTEYTKAVLLTYAEARRMAQWRK